jgi:predicted DNA binding CopG/RHH family protein
MNNNEPIKTIPRFKNEDEERNFWATHDTTEYFDTSKPVEFDLSELQPSTKSVTIRLPESLLEALKTLAHKKDIPYQSLMKVFLAEKVNKEYQTL